MADEVIRIGDFEIRFGISWGSDSSERNRGRERFVYTPITCIPKDFVAIDFETADKTRTSPCAIGVTIVKDGTVKDSFSRLIKPHENHRRFDEFNIQLHGITPEMVGDCPEFDEVMRDIFPLLEDSYVVAHNMSFDASVMCRTGELYNIARPKCKTFCSCSLSKIIWPDLVSHRLPNVCRYLGIDLEHHDPRSDACAAAEIVISAEKETCAPAMLSALEDAGYSYGYIDDEYFYTPLYRLTKESSNTVVGSQEWTKNADNIKPLSGIELVFTGTLSSMTRDQAHQVVCAAGGVPGNGVTRRTSYLVMGIQDYSLFSDGKKSSKTKKAEALKAAGQEIEIISEEDFLNMVEWN